MDSSVREVSSKSPSGMSISSYTGYLLATAIGQTAAQTFTVDMWSLWKVVLFRSLFGYALR